MQQSRFWNARFLEELSPDELVDFVEMLAETAMGLMREAAVETELEKRWGRLLDGLETSIAADTWSPETFPRKELGRMRSEILKLRNRHGCADYGIHHWQPLEEFTTDEADQLCPKLFALLKTNDILSRLDFVAKESEGPWAGFRDEAGFAAGAIDDLIFVGAALNASEVVEQCLYAAEEAVTEAGDEDIEPLRRRGRPNWLAGPRNDDT